MMNRLFYRRRGGSKCIKNIFSDISKDQWLVAANIGVLILMGILHSLEAGHYADFIPINGTFQDYNPIRRFLDGQIPYKDFCDYLGLGHLYLGALFTGLMGGKYRASLIAFRLIAFLSTALIFYVITRITLKKSSISLSVTNILLAILLIQPTFIETMVGDRNVKNALDYAMSTGNSARMIRGAILPLSTFFILKFGQKIFEYVKKQEFKIGIGRLLSIFVGILAGGCLPWSNDYGISSWLCLLLMVFFVALAGTRNIGTTLVCFLMAIVSSLVSCFVVVEIITIGHFTEWFLATFGTGGYQTWYYISGKSYYITDVDFSYVMLIQAFLSLYYLKKIWQCGANEQSVIRYGLLAYVNITSFCAVNEYKLLSGSYSREVALVVLFATIVAEIMNYVGSTSLKEKAQLVIGTASMVVCLSWIISTCQEEFKFHVFAEKQGLYVEAMGGYMTKLGEDIIKTAEFLGDKKTFATYASAQELVSGDFQPSGTDYIIHVLGDKQREKYLESFETDEFDYAVTINENYSVWEFWLPRANWFFYESLFENWHPIYANSYEVYWERNKNDESSVYTGDINVTIEPQMDSRSIKIIVETDEAISGMADVYIDYESSKDGGKTAYLVFNKMVSEVNSGLSMCNDATYDRTYLRDSGKEDIPITIVDGYGEVTLTAEPKKSMVLTINDASCEKIYTVQYQYVCVDAIEENEEYIAFHTVASNRTNKILEDISYIYVDGQKKEISHIENGFILVEKDENRIDCNCLSTENMFKVE